jgi:hypothetical protein
VQRTETARPEGADQRGIFALLRALADSGMDLAHNTARMAACEGRIVLHRVAVRLALFAAGLLVAASGLLLVLVAAALALARVAGIDAPLAFFIVGAVALAAGAAFAVRAMRRLSAPDLAFPATLAELTADVDALRSGRGESPDRPS